MSEVLGGDKHYVFAIFLGFKAYRDDLFIQKKTISSYDDKQMTYLTHHAYEVFTKHLLTKAM